MRILEVQLDNKRRQFVLACDRGTFTYPFDKAVPRPSRENRITAVLVDEELAGEAITYRLASGAQGFVHIEMALDYNREPVYMRNLLLHQLTVDARTVLATSGLTKREVTRRLGTSPSQLYRLLDTANYNKSVDKMLELLSVLGCDVEFAVRERLPVC